MDSIQIQSFCASSNTLLVFASTRFGIHSLFEVSFGIPYTVTQQFSELRSVFCFFPSITLESFSYFGITFTVSLTAHSQIHTYFCTFTHEVVVQVFNHFIITTFSYTDHVFVSKRQRTVFCGFYNFYELAGRSFTQRAFLRSGITFIYVTAYSTSKFFHFLFDLIELVIRSSYKKR